jgi:hypothetical protein
MVWAIAGVIVDALIGELGLQESENPGLDGVVEFVPQRNHRLSRALPLVVVQRRSHSGTCFGRQQAQSPDESAPVTSVRAVPCLHMLKIVGGSATPWMEPTGPRRSTAESDPEEQSHAIEGQDGDRDRRSDRGFRECRGTKTWSDARASSKAQVRMKRGKAGR